MNEKPQKQEIQPTINLQYYQPPQKPKDQKPFDVTPYLPIYNQGIVNPPQFGNAYGAIPYPLPPLIKNIQINTNGPTDDHQRLFIINEDVLPTNSFNPNSTSLGERINMYQFVRSSIFNNTDGEDISLDGKGSKSLLSFIKFGELNPYNTFRYSANPYKGLPNDFLLYRSCYPIRFSRGNGSVICAKDSTAINVRIYKLSEGSYLVNRLDPKSFYIFDEWREIAFYEYIREFILKKKMCPNFPILYGFFIAEYTGIDFDSIVKIKNNKEYKGKENKFFIRVETDREKLIRLKKEQIEGCVVVEAGSTNSNMRLKTQANKIVEINPKAYLGKTVVLLTESPTYNLFGWASKTYTKTGNVKEMINRGVHTDNEWLNILFQLMIALHVMYTQKIYIKNFSIEHNVFIKDIPLKPNTTNYWKYTVQGIDYYLPNMGYLLMIDTPFRDRSDLDSNTFMTFGEAADEIRNNKTKQKELDRKHKEEVKRTQQLLKGIDPDDIGDVYKKENEKLFDIDLEDVIIPDNNDTIETAFDLSYLEDITKHKLFGNFIKSQSEDIDFYNNIYDMYISALDSNIFGKNFIETGGCPPSNTIKNILNQLNKDFKDCKLSLATGAPVVPDIPYCLLLYMTKYLNNRIGTYLLKDTEISNIRRNTAEQFQLGQIAVIEESADQFKFVLFYSTSDDCHYIYTKNNPTDTDVIYLQVPLTSLHHYAKSEPIQQNVKQEGGSLKDDDLIETYII